MALLHSSQSVTNIIHNIFKYNFLTQMQSGQSSCAKNGDAYFSASYGSIKDLIAVPGPKMLEISKQCPTGNFCLATHTYTKLPLLDGHSSRICSEASLILCIC